MKTVEKKSAHLTPVRALIIKAIASKKQLTLEALAMSVFHTNLPKLCRKLRREKLINYRWNEDGTRTLGVTAAALKLLSAQ